MTAHWQCAQRGAMAWIAHSKESKVPVTAPWVTVKLFRYALPQTSQVAMTDSVLVVAG